MTRFPQTPHFQTPAPHHTEQLRIDSTGMSISEYIDRYDALTIWMDNLTLPECYCTDLSLQLLLSTSFRCKSLFVLGNTIFKRILVNWNQNLSSRLRALRAKTGVEPRCVFREERYDNSEYSAG